MFDSSNEVVKRLFVLAYDYTEGNNQVSVNCFKNYFLPRVKTENYNIEIVEGNFYDQSINELIKQYDEVRKVSTWQGDDHTTGCLFDLAYFEKNYRLIAADLSEQKALDVDSRAIQQIIFTAKIKSAVANTRVIIFFFYEYDIHNKKMKNIKKNKLHTT